MIFFLRLFWRGFFRASAGASRVFFRRLHWMIAGRCHGRQIWASGEALPKRTFSLQISLAGTIFARREARHGFRVVTGGSGAVSRPAGRSRSKITVIINPSEREPEHRTSGAGPHSELSAFMYDAARWAGRAVIRRADGRISFAVLREEISASAACEQCRHANKQTSRARWQMVPD
jgi:hypothetical protein